MIEGYRLSRAVNEISSAYRILDKSDAIIKYNYVLIFSDGQKEIIHMLDLQDKYSKMITKSMTFKYTYNHTNILKKYKELTPYFEYIRDVVTPALYAFVDKSQENYPGRFKSVVNVWPELEYGAFTNRWVFQYGIYDTEDGLIYVTPVVIDGSFVKDATNYIPNQINYEILNTLYNKFIY